ncbi:MAG TPA: hypothetical protein PLK24_03020, partial [Atribacter sp.]|nr:hypothetical protein [Atribacter sp.]
KGKSCIFITHNIYHVYPVADRIVVLDRGSVVGQFRKDEISLEELVNRLYLVARTGKLNENGTSTVACDQLQDEMQSKMP